MRKRDKRDRPDSEWKDITDKDIKRSIFVKGKGSKGLRFEWLERFHYWWLGARSITRSLFRVVAAKQTIAIISSILFTLYVFAAFYTHAGEFVIKVEHPGEKKLILSDTPDFPEELITLNGKAIPNADNISIFDVAPDVVEVDGEHNGIDYVAYTFYVKNISLMPITYDYTLHIKRATKGIEEAAWVMLYHNGQQHIFAKESKSGGAESQHAEFEFPFKDMAGDIGQYSYDEKTGIYTLTAKPFASSNVVSTNQRPEIQPQEIDKFSVVIWLEGEDPECVNDILGGTIEMMMKFRY